MKYEKGTFITIPNKKRLDGKPSEMQAVFFWLCNYIDDDGDCFPSRAKIAKNAGCSVRTVDKYLKQLEDEGFIVKKSQYKESTGQTSNLYSVQILRGRGEILDTPPSVKNDTLTQSNINSIHLTHLPDIKSGTESIIKPEQEEVIDITKLPVKFGKTTILRLGLVYRNLWFGKYGTPCSAINYGKFGKLINGLLKDHTEMQIAVLLFTYFNWYGGTGDDMKENIYLSNKGFPLEMMINKIDIMVAYLTNNRGLCYTKPEEVRKYAVDNLRKILA